MLVYTFSPVFSPFSAHFYPPPHYIIMVKGLLVKEDTAVGSYEKFDEKNLTV